MSVTKYRSVADVPRPGRVAPEDLAESIGRTWALAFTLCPPEIPRGVQRFRSVEDAGREREARTLARMRRLRAEHAPPDDTDA